MVLAAARKGIRVFLFFFRLLTQKHKHRDYKLQLLYDDMWILTFTYIGTNGFVQVLYRFSDTVKNCEGLPFGEISLLEQNSRLQYQFWRSAGGKTRVWRRGCDVRTRVRCHRSLGYSRDTRKITYIYLCEFDVSSRRVESTRRGG